MRTHTVHARCLAAFFLLIACPATLWAWPGHDWNQWKSVTTWRKADLKTDQAGRKDLAPLLENRDGEPKRIDGIKAWESKRARIVNTLSQLFGDPGDLKPLEPQAELLKEESIDGYVRRHIRIRTEKDDWIPAYLLLPKPVPTTPTPVMICLHQTVAQGKDEPCGIRGDKSLAFAVELVRRGYVCIAPDVIGFGERIPAGATPYANSLEFYRRHPGWSFFGKMNWDISRVVDYLQTLPFVDPLQIGCIGHSHGAYGSLMAAAFEPRISAAIASCGFNLLRSDPTPERWSHMTALLPQLGMYLPDVASIPFDWHEICAMVAPRPLCVWYATNDKIFPNTENLKEVFVDVGRVYGLYGAADDLVGRAFNGSHSFPDSARDDAYAWLAERFIPIGDLNRKPADAQTWEQQRPLLQRVIRRSFGPPTTQPVAPDVKVLSKETLPKYERRLIEYAVEKDERIKAYLCIPRTDRRLLPAILVLHQTAAEGKDEAVGIAGNKTLAFGAELAERGYITLSPDSICAGERIDSFGAFDTRGYYLGHPDRSAMGKMLADAQQALNVLIAVDGVDAGRIGSIGHSLGAEESLVLAAFDERIKAAVTSCGYATFQAEKDRCRWARDAWFSYMPKLRPVFQTGRLPHWDWDDVIRLVAPRALYQYNTQNDQIFPESKSAFEAGEAARPIWALYGKADLLQNAFRPGKHEIAEPDKVDIYKWLDRQLIPIRK